MFCYFACEIHELRLDLYTQFLISLYKDIEALEAPEVLVRFASELDLLKADDWKLFHSCFENTSNGEPLIDSLQLDDLNLFLERASARNFDYDASIPCSIFGRCPFLQYHPPLISFAAFHRSVKCFKHLLLLGANIDHLDIMRRSAIDFAIAGGCLEIVRLLEERGASFSDQSLSIAARFHRYDIFIWLVEQKGLDPRSSPTVLNDCARACSLEILLECIALGCDVNACDSFGLVPLHYASRASCTDALNLLLSHKGIETSPLTAPSTPLQEAISEGLLKSVELMLRSGKVDVNMRNVSVILKKFSIVLPAGVL
jgi:ankyrin repeat protein